MDGNANRILLGTVGWQRADWDGSYYPDDLPAEWRLAFYANDCDCVLLRPAHDDGDALVAALAELDADLSFFVDAAAAGPRATLRLIDGLRGRPVVLLGDGPVRDFGALPQWLRQADGDWCDPASGQRLVRWNLDLFDLRDLRSRAHALPASARAVVLDGTAAVPAQCRDLRVLLQLLDDA
jgi:hypothetical protein